MELASVVAASRGRGPQTYVKEDRSPAAELISR